MRPFRAVLSYLFAVSLLVSSCGASAVGPVPVNPTHKAQSIVLTSDNMVVLSGPMDDESAGRVVQHAQSLDAKLKSGYPIYLVIDSPGGSIESGVRLIAALRTLNRPVHTVTIFGASMAFHTVEGLGQRYILKRGTLMSHRARGGLSGELPGSLDTRVNYYLKRVRSLDEDAVARTGGKQTLQSYSLMIQNEYWCDGQDCVKAGFADGVVEARCDSTLSGTRTEEIKMFVGYTPADAKIIWPACPLIPGVMGFSVSASGLSEYSYNDDDKARMREVNKAVSQMLQRKTSRDVIAY